MKKILSLVLLAAALLLSAPTFTGCGTVGKTATQVEGVVVISVDTAMKGWKDWVVAGHASQKQVDTVKALYNDYYAAQVLAKQALLDFLTVSGDTAKTDAERAAAKAALESASANAAAKSTALISTITTLKK